jgi:hypothetical protein
MDERIQPDDGFPVDWFTENAGYKIYSAPFAYENKVLVIAGKTSKEICIALEKVIDDLVSSFL